MPVATRKQDTVRHDLKTLSGGWVELRQLSYDEMLERRDGASRMLMESGPRGANAQWAMQVANRWSNQYSFPRCIVDHNLTDENGVQLDFRHPELVFQHLDPKIGQEIERLIDELNNEEEVELGNFLTAPSSSSPDENHTPKNSSEQN